MSGACAAITTCDVHTLKMVADAAMPEKAAVCVSTTVVPLDGEGEGEGETEAAALLLGVTERLGAGETLREPDTEPVTEVVVATLGVTDAEIETEATTLLLGVTERPGVGETEVTTLLLGVTERLGVGETLREPDTEPVTEAEEATLGVTDDEIETEATTLLLGVTERPGVSETEATTLLLGVTERLGVGETLREAVAERDAEKEGEDEYCSAMSATAIILSLVDSSTMPLAPMIGPGRLTGRPPVGRVTLT